MYRYSGVDGDVDEGAPVLTEGLATPLLEAGDGVVNVGEKPDDMDGIGIDAPVSPVVEDMAVGV